MSDRDAPPTDLHALAQSLACASLSVDAARAFLAQGKADRVDASLASAARALERASHWMEDARAMSNHRANAEVG